MKSLMASAAAAALMLSFSAPAFADCAEEIAALNSQQSTGSIEEPTSSDQTAEQAAAAPAEDSAAPADDEVAAAPAAEAPAPSTEATAPAEVASVDLADGDASKEAIGPTAALTELTEGVATSPEEVEEQATAQPAETAPNAEQQADQAAGGEEVAISKSFTSGGEAVNMVEVAVARAEAYQKLGNEGACLNVIEQAKQQ